MASPPEPVAQQTAPSKRAIALRWALRLLGPVLLIVVLVKLKDRGALLALASNAAILPLVLALLLNSVAIHLKVVRWQILLKSRGHTYGTRDAWLAFCASLYLGMLTPGRVGDALRVQYLRHDRGVPYAEGFASIVVDRLCDMYILAAFAATAFAHFSSAIAGELAILGWASVAASVLGPLILWIPGLSEKLMSAAYRKVSRDTEGRGLAVFLAAVRGQTGKMLFVTLPLTVVSFVVSTAQGWLIARSIGLDLKPFDVLCLLAIASLLGLLPISVSGVGVREAFFAVVFPALGFTSADGVGFGLLVFTVIYLSNVIVGFVAWQIRPPPTAISREVTPASPSENAGPEPLTPKERA